MKKIAFVIASDGFQHVEYGVPKKMLEDAGIEVVTISDNAGMATGKDGSHTKVDIVLEKFHPQEVEGLFFIGGPGALEHLDNQESNRILNEAMLLQKPYGAICVSPRILAKANVLTGKRATGWDEDNKLSEIFANNNVEYVREPVVVDGNVITGNGPAAAEEWGRAILSFLNKLS